MVLKSHVAQLLETVKSECQKILNIYNSAFLLRRSCFLHGLKMLFSQMLYALIDVLLIAAVHLCWSERPNVLHNKVTSRGVELHRINYRK